MLLLGIVSVIWFLFWLLLVADTPLEHPTISREELEYIQQTAGYINIDNSVSISVCEYIIVVSVDNCTCKVLANALLK